MEGWVGCYVGWLILLIEVGMVVLLIFRLFCFMSIVVSWVCWVFVLLIFNWIWDGIGFLEEVCVKVKIGFNCEWNFELEFGYLSFSGIEVDFGMEFGVVGCMFFVCLFVVLVVVYFYSL